MSKLNTIKIIALLTMVEMITDSISYIASDMTEYDTLSSILLWVGYGVFRGFRFILKD